MATRRDKLIQVEIYGQRYSLRAPEDQDAEYVEAVAALVDSRMKEIARTTPTVDSFKVAVLAAVNIADEYYRMRSLTDGLDTYIEEKTEQINRLLDETSTAAG